MSDTPETDKCIESNKHIKFLQQDHWIGTDKFTYENPIVDLCRKLEREREEAMAALVYIAHSGLSARHLSDYAKEVLRKLR